MAATHNLTPTISITDFPSAANSTAQADRGTPDIVIQQHVAFYRQNGVVAADAGEVIWIAKKAGTIEAAQAVLAVAPTGTHDVSIEILKGNAGGAYTSILSSPILFDTGVDRTPLAATLAVTSYLEADSFQVVVTIPTSNADGTDLLVMLWLREQPS
ncbi:hypothetical protein LCGC14_0583230 [marine sediment metagenome]|uniref:Uncharacterized protein n=1 Tax=marine sediment metagenome TaxID=412755 RepID=A0A0F9UP00_9ZZZZ